MLKRRLITQYAAGALTLNQESDVIVDELVKSEAPVGELVEAAEVELSENDQGLLAQDQEYAAATEEVIEMESCTLSMSTILNMESIAEGLVEAGATEEAAVTTVIEPIVDAVEAVEEGAADEGEIAMEAEVPGAARRFWDKVKEMFRKLKEATISLLRNIATRLGRFWDNIVLSGSRVKKAGENLLAVLRKLPNWDEKATLDARSAWVVNGKVEAKAISNAVKQQTNVNRGFSKHFKAELGIVDGIAKQIKNSTKFNLEDILKGKGSEDKSLEQLMSLFIGFQFNSETGEVSPAKLEAKTTITVPSKRDVETLIQDVIKVATTESKENGSLKADLKNLSNSINEAVKGVEASLSAMEKAGAEEAKKEEAGVRLKQLRALQSRLGGVISSLKWYFKGLPLRSCNNALSFASASIRAAGKE